MKNCWHIRALIFLTISAVVTSAPPPNCNFAPTNEITDDNGEITEAALYREHNCNYTWEFTKIPNKNFMLILNITRLPLARDVIKLFDEDFIEGNKNTNCRILEFQHRNFRTKLDIIQAEEIHNNFTGCKLRSGVKPPVRLSYYGRDHFFVEPTFTIQYKAIPVNFNPPSFTKDDASSTITSTARVTSTTNASGKSEQGIPTITIGLGVLGGLVFILALFLAAALFIRRKKLQHSVSKEQCRATDFYQSVPDDVSSKENSSGHVYYNEQANGNCGVHLPQQNNIKIPRKTSKTEQNDDVQAENVTNPLYVSQDGIANHSYEYIDVRIPARRDDRSSPI